MHESTAAWMGSSHWGMLLATTLFLLGISQAWIALSATFRVTRATWPKPIQPVLESMVMFAPLAVLFLGLALFGGRHHLFFWLDRHENAYWLNFPHLAFRTIVFNIGFYLLAMVMNSRAHAMKQSGAMTLSTLVLIAFFVVQTVLSWDFGTNLEKHWHLSVFGPFFIVGNLQVGAAAAILTFAWLRRSPLGAKLGVQQFDFMGQLMLGFTFVWIYCAWSMYLVIWYGNLPHETAPLNLRIWEWAPRLFWTMLIVKLFLPFLMLINTHIRRSVGGLSLAAALVLVGGFIEKYLIVVPAVHSEPLHFDAPLLLRHGAILAATLVATLITWRVWFRRHRVLETA